MMQQHWKRSGIAISIQVVLSIIIIFVVDEKVHTFVCSPLSPNQSIYHYNRQKQGEPPVPISEWTRCEAIVTMTGLLLLGCIVATFIIVHTPLLCCIIGFAYVFSIIAISVMLALVVFRDIFG